MGEVEAAAARFCEALRRAGQTPEGMLIDAKKVIEDAIDGDDVPTAERAVTSCIKHYFRPEDGRPNLLTAAALRIHPRSVDHESLRTIGHRLGDVVHE